PLTDHRLLITAHRFTHPDRPNPLTPSLREFITKVLPCFLGDAFKLPGNIWKVRHHIVLFCGIASKVIQRGGDRSIFIYFPWKPVLAGIKSFVCPPGVAQDKLPVIHSYGFEVISPVVVIEILAGSGIEIALYYRDKAYTVDLVFGQIRVHQGSNRREHVDPRNQAIAYAPRFDGVFPAHNQRHAVSTFKCCTLTLPESTRGT